MAVASLMAAGCHTINDDRIPPAPVNVPFITEAQWNLCGVAGAMDYNYFIREERVPPNYAYSAASQTGFGGVLLVGSVLGEPLAYDLACPVERSASVRISINARELVAECPRCGSTYDVFSLGGHPLSGPAADKGYGLRRYHVGRGRVDFMVISY